MKSAATIKILLMIFAFVGVIYVMRSLNKDAVQSSASDPQSALGILMGADLRPLNWCPPNTYRIVLFNSAGQPIKSYGAEPELSRLCEVMVGGFQKPTAEIQFFKRATATNTAGDEKTLDESLAGGVFRVQEMPFSSKMLESALKALTTP